MIDQYLLDSEHEYTAELVGIKVKNLVPYRIYTPEFIVLSTEFYKGWSSDTVNFLQAQAFTLTNIAKYFQKRDYNNIILRSSCTKEDITHRGRYLSEVCKPNVDEIKNVIKKIYEDFENQKTSETEYIAIIVQAYQVPKIRGHLSNERRVNQDKFYWLLEEESVTTAPNISTSFNVKAGSPFFDQSLSRCLNYSTLIKNIETLAAWFSNTSNRYHIEWLWNGKSLWILQVDQENEYTYRGLKPGSEWVPPKTAVKLNNLQDFEVLETAVTTLKDWRKIECVRTFEKCKLPYWQIYILENESILQELSEGIHDVSLLTDLKKLLVMPIVIRSETVRRDFLSPRTNAVSTLQEALDFLERTTKDFIADGHKIGDFCFLMHQFIVSTAGALSFTRPNTDIVRIDSTWGIVEGLYYYPYDSFELNKNPYSIRKKIRCKSQYIDVDPYGEWYLKEAGINFDWSSSLSEEQVKEISSYTEIISKHLGTQVNVMFFINKHKAYPKILPWFYTQDEVSNTVTIYNNILSVKNRVVIKTKADFIKLRDQPDRPEKINLFIVLNFDLYRDKDLIDEIAVFAKENNYTVDIKGSMLSHPYYVFHSKGVHIRCIDPFQPEYATKKFYKLVRDKIPALIISNNEKVKTRKVSPAQLLLLLKNKIVEEANEFHWAKSDDDNIEEMSDVLEVLRATCSLYGLKLADLEDIADAKREKRGGFEEGTVLIATKEQSAINLVKETGDLFSEEDKEIDLKAEQKVQLFQKGDVDNLKSLTEVNNIILPYVNNLASKTNVFRYFLKDEKYNSITIEYDPKHIVLKFEVLTSDLKDPSQLKLFTPSEKE